MRIAALLLAPVLVVIALCGCSGLHVQSDYDPAVDFASFITYAWLPQPEPSKSTPGIVSDQLLERRVRKAVDDTLATKGLREAPEAEADLLVISYVSVAQKVQVTTTPYYGYGTWDPWGGGVYTETRVDQYDEGTLVIDLVLADKKELAWRGTAQSRLRKTKTPEEREQRVREAVEAVLANYPPE